MDTSINWGSLMYVPQRTSGLLKPLRSHFIRAYHSISHLTHPDIRPSNLYIDAVSLPMLNGSTVDYATELIGSSFRVTGNPQAKGGCGCGVSWELND